MSEQNNRSSDMEHAPKSRGRMVMLLIVAVVVAGIAIMGMRNGESPVTTPPKPTPGQEDVRLDLPVTAPKPEAQAEENPASGDSGIPAAVQPEAQADEAAPAVTDAEQQQQSGHAVTQEIQTLSQEEAAVQQADSVVRPAFIQDGAKLLVEGYFPKGTHPDARERGLIAIGPKSANQHFGIEMTGIAWAGDDILQGRRAVLQHVLTPAVMEALFGLYADDFVASMQELAEKRTIDGRTLQQWEVREMFALYGQRVRGVAGTLRATSNMEGAMARVQALHSAGQKALQANGDFLSALHTYQELQEANASEDQVEQARAVMDAASSAYNQAIAQRERVREGLGNALRRYKWVKEIPEPEAIYVAKWVYRRTQHIPDTLPKVFKAHELLLELSQKFEAAARPE